MAIDLNSDIRNQVVLVDEHDRAIGSMDKMEAHLKGQLHRAFSIFIFNNKGEMLIHQRASDKYHGANLWTNACCSHPQWDEDLKSSAINRLQYEMGIDCDIKWSHSFIYNTPVENGLIEHEYDHVFIGYTDQNPNPNPNEVQDYAWIAIGDMNKLIVDHPDQFTYWFKTALNQVLNKILS